MNNKNRDDVSQCVHSIIREVYDADLYSDVQIRLLGDSLDVMDLEHRIRGVFGVPILCRDLDRLTVNGLIDLLSDA